MTEQKPALHQSQLEMLSKCGMQYEFRYVKGIIRPPGVAAVVGTATHRSIERNLRSVIDNDELLPEGDCADIAAEALIATWEGEDPRLTEDERSEGVAAVKGASKDKAVRLALLHRQVLAPVLLPAYVERPFRLVLKGRPVDLSGTMDIVEREDIELPDGADPGMILSLRDTKTSKKTPKNGTAHASTQLTVYSLAVKVLDGGTPSQIALDTLVDLKKGPKIDTQFTKRTDAHFDALLRRVDRAVGMIESGCFLPAPDGAWWCAAEWCGWWGACDYGQRSRSKPAGFEV